MCRLCHDPPPDPRLEGTCNRCGYSGNVWVIHRRNTTTWPRWRLERVCQSCIAYSLPAAA